jgi:hypothetical protein
VPVPKLLIKQWLPIETIGFECMRDWGALSALLPLYFLHVWSESSDARLGLLLPAVKPLRKARRMADISEQVQQMSEERVYYWFS